MGPQMVRGRTLFGGRCKTGEVNRRNLLLPSPRSGCLWIRTHLIIWWSWEINTDLDGRRRRKNTERRNALVWEGLGT